MGNISILAEGHGLLGHSALKSYQDALAFEREQLKRWKDIALSALDRVPNTVLVYDAHGDPHVWEVIEVEAGQIRIMEWYGREGRYGRGTYSRIWFDRDDTEHPCCSIPAEVLNYIRKTW